MRYRFWLRAENRKELIDQPFAHYKKPEDIMWENGLAND